MNAMLKIEGVHFRFPFEPYPSQMKYMSSLITALNKKENALLESPTGTGKTLSLLIPAIAYQEQCINFLSLVTSLLKKCKPDTNISESAGAFVLSSNALPMPPDADKLLEWTDQTLGFRDSVTVNSKLKIIRLNDTTRRIAEQLPPKILYAARTHAQIEQAIRQLKNYSTTISGASGNDKSSLFWPIAMLGSRRIFCINERAHTYAAAANITLSMACKKICDDRQCRYYSNDRDNDNLAQKYREYYCENSNGRLDDLEDFFGYCKKESRCPYYLGRALVPQARVITAPYNYILSSKSRTSELSSMLRNSILLVDEGHNIGQACCDAFSGSVTIDALLKASEEIQHLQKVVEVQRMGPGNKAATLELEGNWLSNINPYEPAIPYTGLSEPKTKLIRQSVERLYSLSDGLPPQSDINAISNLVNLVSKYFADKLTGISSNTPFSFAVHDISKTVYELLLATDFESGDHNTQSTRFSRAATDIETTKFYLSSKSVAVHEDAVQSLRKKQQQFSLLVDTISIFIQCNPNLAPEYADKPLHLLEASDFILAISDIMIYSQTGSEFCFVVSKQKENDTTSKSARPKSARGMSEFLNNVIKKHSSNAMPTIVSQTGWQVHLLCMTPKSILKTIMIGEGVHSLVLTSGTLAPFSALQAELGLPFNISVSCPHIVSPSNYLLRAITAVTGTPLLGTYTNRESKSYQRCLGYALQTCVRGVVGGTLVFFSSYKYMIQVLDSWKADGTEAELKSDAHGDPRDLFVEPVRQHDCNAVIRKYKDSCDAGRSPILFVICRGKLAEGIDFSNNYCRCALVISLPYPNISDPLLKIKMDWLDKHSVLKGSDWYSVHAYRTVNQALGRVLRHKDDYGCMFLLDQRYSVEINRKQLSEWLAEHLVSVELSGVGIQTENVFAETCAFYSKRTSSLSSTSTKDSNPSDKMLAIKKLDESIFKTRDELGLLMQEFANPLKNGKVAEPSTTILNETSSATHQLLTKFKGKLTEVRYKQLKLLLRDVQLVQKSDQKRIQKLCNDLAILLYNRTLSQEVSGLLKVLEPHVASELKTQISFLQKRL
ncbi:TFIIH basal transcription factor complex helicase subunit [Giardia lamblia P15]|uniref:TFIIH basal transcription factor complex helicase subunit n=1 Tax=Giardia intestinalis (strain P15) TaxID=658858 RepID=E1F1R9_GIAIA|nr:TFIIH basal transcription factor complex helicase subunit [Giardia lamblia P15]